MTEAKMNVFFYGSFINRAILAEVKLIPDQVEVALLWGFDISIQPLANLIRSDQHSVYGIICQATHAELDRLYAQHWVETYLPEAVLVETNGGGLKHESVDAHHVIQEDTPEQLVLWIQAFVGVYP